MKKLAILGASGHGKVVADTARCCGWKYIDFFDDSNPDDTGKKDGWKIVGNSLDLHAALDDFAGVIVAIGDNRIRLAKHEKLIEMHAPLVTLIHPAAVVSSSAKLGLGTVVFAGGIINADVELGVSGIINTGATVDHDCRLGNAVHVSPGAHLAGGVEVGCEAWIGIGACIKQEVKIGSKAIVGAGAVVLKDVYDNTTVVGNPAKQIK